MPVLLPGILHNYENGIQAVQCSPIRTCENAQCCTI